MTKSIIVLTAILFTLPATAAESLVPVPPDLHAIYNLVTRPTGDCNAADYFRQAEAQLRDHSRDEKNGCLKEKSRSYELVEQGLNCRRCEFPFSLDMKLPPYEQMIPMMKLYRAAARTYAQNGREAMEKKDYAAAAQWFSKAVNLGLLLWEEPGITIIQDMITMVVLSEGVEGFGDMFIAQGNGDQAAVCAKFLAEKTAYMEALPKFVNRILRDQGAWPPRATDSYKEVARLYPTVTYLPIKVEILLTTAEINAFNEDADTKKLCHSVIEAGKADPDARIRKIAGWAEELSKSAIMEMVKANGGEVPEDAAK